MPASYDLSGKGKQNFARNPIYANSAESETYINDAYDDVTNGSVITKQNSMSAHPEKSDAIKRFDRRISDVSSVSSKSSKKKDKKPEKPPMVGAGEVFKYASGQERLLIVLGVLFACIHGAVRPITIILFGNMTDSFISDGALEDHLKKYVPQWLEACLNMTIGLPGNPCENITMEYIEENPSSIFEFCFKLGFPPGCEIINNTDPTEPIEGLFDQITDYSIIFAIIAAVELIVGYIQVLCWQTAALNQTQRIRVQLFRSILRQEIGWFDTHEVGELNTRMSDDVEKIEAGIGDKLGMFFNEVSTFVAGIIIGFVYSWKLTLVILSASPLIVLSGMAMGKVGSKMMSKELKAYAKAGAVAEEVLGAIRTVMAFGGERKESARYNVHLLEACRVGTKKGITQGMVTGLIMLVMFGSYALGFWYGSTLVFDDAITPGDLITVFFCVLMGTFSVGNAAPHIQDFAGARGAAHAIFGIIEQEPEIDSSSKEGKQNIDVTGNVKFSDVHFNYPSRPDVKVLQGLSMEIRVGQTVALVGSSGCGKSTTVQLLQRFYDPLSGQVSMDGTDIREYNVKWLRQQIGVVSQEPVLFGTTIAENIKYGQDGINANDIIQACKEANAHDFITKLPKKYDTLVGERGAQLSGGQKQRIAIARALVRNPKILLLDEATSALDTESEATVQAALDTARMGRTTLVIAHRLSTIRTADVIIGVKDGQVIEQGTHDELMKRKGLYHELVMNQQAHFEEVENMGNEAEVLPLKAGLERALSTASSGKFQRGMSTLSAGSGHHKPSPITDETEDKLPDPEVSRMLRMNAPEWIYILLGCFSALVAGCMQPAFALVFSEILGIFAETGPEAQDRVSLFSGIFVVIGVVTGLAMLGTNAAFSRSGEALTMRLRELSFQALLRQEMAYFDDHSNNVGALCTRLATDASAVQGATGSRLGMFCQAIAGVLGGLVIGFVYSWELTLLIIAFGPFLLATGFIQMRLISGNRKNTKKSLETAGKVAIQAIENIRTVATLTKEQTFLEDYENETIKPFIVNKKKIHIQALAFGFSQAIMFWAQSAAFALGAFLVENKGLAYEDMYRVFMAVVLGAVSAGRASSFAPDYGKAKASAAKIFQLLDRRSAIDGSDPSGVKPANCHGNIKMRDVSFNYPTRPDVPVLRGLDLDVTPGKRVALVGSSGCGKSTTIQLLQRFYDPHNGEVSVEGETIPDLNIQWLRSQMGIVSQEPILFDSSIRDNIAYGDNSREVSMGEIIEAAKNANIHSFIESLPQGYDTNVGDKGAQLSGGQKQRVAIARALVRNPKILLLDEATSALDTESEKVVQAALDRAQEGRTCIVIAHRLSTIQNADCIVVIHHGKVVEMGTHSELLQSRGRYYKLNNAQLTKD